MILPPVALMEAQGVIYISLILVLDFSLMPKGRFRSSKPRKFPSITKSSQVKRKITDLQSVKTIEHTEITSDGILYSTDCINDRYKMELDLDNCDYPCGICMKPVTDNDEAILCDSGNDIINNPFSRIRYI